MPIRRGFAKVKEAKETGGRGGNFSLRFALKDGESAMVRFYGDFENQLAPVVGVQHYVHRLAQGHQYHYCTDNLPEGADNQGCVFCHMQNQGDKGIKKQQRAFFWLKDYRKVHKLDQEVKILKPGIPRIPGRQYAASDYVTTKYPPCTAPKSPCAYCKQGNKAEINGYREWELAVQYADQLVSQQASIRDYCKCGGRTEDNSGTIQVSRYLCGYLDEDGNMACGEEVDFDPNRGHPVAQCGSCGQTTAPLEEISCSTCDSPMRCDLQDFVFKVTRTGEKMDTTYNFEAVQQKTPSEEDLKEAFEKMPDFEAKLQPEAPELQAAALGVPSPFQTPGHGAQGYARRPGAAPAAAGPRKLGINTGGPQKLGRATPPPEPEEEEIDYE